jgi:Repeat of Unknown Function (DUF347)
MVLRARAKGRNDRNVVTSLNSGEPFDICHAPVWRHIWRLAHQAGRAGRTEFAEGLRLVDHVNSPAARTLHFKRQTEGPPRGRASGRLTSLLVLMRLATNGGHLRVFARERFKYGGCAGREAMSAGRHRTAKVASITLGFWVAKVAATTLGETGGDTITMTLNFGYVRTAAILFGVLLVLVALQSAPRSSGLSSSGRPSSPPRCSARPSLIISTAP